MQAPFTRTRITPLDGAQNIPLKTASADRYSSSIAARVSSVFTYVSHSHGYSREKFLALQRYTERTSPWRVAAVLLVTPIPGLLGALLPSFVPLQNPLGRVRESPGFLVNAFIICFVVEFGTLMHWRAVSGLPSAAYTVRQLCLVTLIASTAQWLFVVAISFLWTFPIPMSWIVSSSVSAPVLALGHLVVFRERCWQDQELINGIRAYTPALLFQCIQIVLYPAFSVLFDNVTPIYQVLLTLAFPLIKYVMKKGLRKYTRWLRDFSTEVAVTGIEICASLYQSMILQNAPSQVALTIIMVFDVLQGLVAVKFFMDRPSHIPRNQIVREALDVLGGAIAVNSFESHPLHRQDPIEVRPQLPLALTTHDDDLTKSVEGCHAARVHPPVTKSQLQAPDTVPALQLVAVAESILLVEYLEVAIPLLNTLFVAISCQLGNAQYNPRLRRLYFSREAHAAAVQSMLLYSLLQALSFVAMHLVMRYRYGLSAVYQLAFILEHHWQSIVGKMIAWLPIILHFTVVHYGVDFSFRFDFAAILRDADSE